MSKEIIRSVIDRVLWAAGATEWNRDLLAGAISEALAAAPQVVADERDLPEMTDDLIFQWAEGYVFTLKGMPHRMTFTRPRFVAAVRTIIAHLPAAAPVQAQEPVDSDEIIVPMMPAHLLDFTSNRLYGAAYCMGFKARAELPAPVQPVAVPDPLYQAMHDFRDDVLSGIDGLDNGQINAVLGTFDNYMLDEPAAPAAQGDAIYIAAKEYRELQEKIRASGRPPHTDYWHQSIAEAEAKLDAAVAAKAAS